MNNTDKLLRAFIEASGFEIETTEDIKRYYHRDSVMANGEPKERAMPESIIKTVDYKVTKRVTNTILDVSKGVNALDSVAGLGRLTSGDDV